MSKWWRRLVGVVSIAGGGLGLGVIGYTFLQGGPASNASGPGAAGAWVAFSLLAAFFALGLWSGVLLLGNLGRGFAGSRVFWGLQVLSLNTPPVIYNFTAGVFAGIEVPPAANPSLAVYLTSAGTVAFSAEPWPALPIVAVNFFAVAVLLSLTTPTASTAP